MRLGLRAPGDARSGDGDAERFSEVRCGDWIAEAVRVVTDDVGDPRVAVRFRFCTARSAGNAASQWATPGHAARQAADGLRFRELWDKVASKECE